MASTSSFRELPHGWQDDLRWLHDDYYHGRQDALWRGNALRTLPALQVGGTLDTGPASRCFHGTCVLVLSDSAVADGVQDAGLWGRSWHDTSVRASHHGPPGPHWCAYELHVLDQKGSLNAVN